MDGGTCFALQPSRLGSITGDDQPAAEARERANGELDALVWHERRNDERVATGASFLGSQVAGGLESLGLHWRVDDRVR